MHLMTLNNDPSIDPNKHNDFVQLYAKIAFNSSEQKRKVPLRVNCEESKNAAQFTQ